jgi:rhamnosyltransferase
MKNNINAIIVAFNPNIKNLQKLIESLFLLDLVVLFKNSEFELTVKNSNLKVIQSLKNIGTGGAYNYCLNHLTENCEYVLILDQDTLLEESCLSQYNIEALELSKTKKHFMISPVEIDMYGVYHGWGSLKGCLTNSTEVRASGMFVTKKTFEIVKFDDNLFLDYVDWDFCWRAVSSIELFILKSLKAKVYHELGSPFYSHWGNRYNTMAPIRIYFQIINAKKMFFKKNVALCKRILLLIRIFKLFFISWIYKDFLKRYKYIIYGILHSDIKNRI